MQHKHNIRREKRKKNDKIDESSKIERMNHMITLLNSKTVCHQEIVYGLEGYNEKQKSGATTW